MNEREMETVCVCVKKDKLNQRTQENNVHCNGHSKRRVGKIGKRVIESR